MPRKNKAAAPQPQVRPTLLKLSELRPPKISGTLAEEMRQVSQALQRSPLAGSLRRFAERAPFSELAKQLGNRPPPADLRVWLGRSAEPAEQSIKKTAWRTKIEHAAEAIDQMLGEQEKDPSLRLVKAQVDRVKAILGEKHIRVANKQRRTLQRMIKERAALKRQSEQG